MFVFEGCRVAEDQDEHSGGGPECASKIPVPDLGDVVAGRDQQFTRDTRSRLELFQESLSLVFGLERGRVASPVV